MRLAANSIITAVVALALVTPDVARGVEKKVLIIGVDGAGGRYFRDAATPNFDTLAAAGGVRYDYLNEGALVAAPPEGYGASGVNWSTIVTGASAANHGVIDNSFSGNDFANHPHFFKHVKDANPALFTASLSNWTPINTQILNNAYADLEVGYDVGTTSQQDTLVKNDAVALLSTSDPDALFLHFDQVDAAGHQFSWGSTQHTLAIQAVDTLVGQVMGAVNARPGVVSGEEDWLVLVTADHGATRGSFSHFASQGLENWEVPFIVSGPSVADGAALAQGTLRDVATTALWHLGIDPFLAGLDGQIRGLSVLPPGAVFGDLNGDGVVSGNGSGLASADDVTVFLQNWMASGPGGVVDRIARGDVNVDGVTNLGDWALINTRLPSFGAAIGHALFAIPEPTTGVCLLVALSLTTLLKPRAPR